MEHLKLTHVLLAMLVAAGAPRAAQCQKPAPPEFLLSSTDLGATDHPKATAEQLAAQLQEEGWCKATAAKSGSRWNQPPAGADMSRWVSVVTAGFHQQSEAYAYMFDPASGAITRAAHVSHHKFMSMGALVWAPPFAKLFNGLQVAWQERPRNASRRLLGITIKELAAGPAEPTADNNKLAVDEALTLPPERVLPPLEAIIFAAAYDAGWAPTARTADNTALVEVRVRDQACWLRITFTIDGKRQVVLKERVPWQEYHEQLRRMFELPLLGDQVTDFARLDTGPLPILAAHDGKLFAIVDDELAALDLATGTEAWRVRILQSKTSAIKKVERYAIRTAADGSPRIFRFTKSLAEFNLADGKEQVLTPIPAPAAWSFDVAGDRAAITAAAELAVFQRGQKVWTKSEAHPVSCGPALLEDRVVAGNQQGELFARALSDGRELWRTPLAGGLFGRVVHAAGLLLAYSQEGDSLTAVDPASGTVRWKLAAGDALLQAPALVEGRLLVVTKGNRVLLVEPQDGVVAREITWPTWLVNVVPIAGQRKLLAVSDIDGQVAFLSSDTLAKVSSVKLPVKFATGMAAVPQMRTRWAGSREKKQDEILTAIDDAAAESRPLVLAGDLDGFLYLIRIPGGK